jgi:putative membrane protein
MIRKFTVYLASIVLLLGSASCGGDDSIEQAANQSVEQFESMGMQGMKNDALFVAEATSANMLHMQLGDMALERAVSPEVKEMAQEMRSGHGRVMEDLQNIGVQRQFVVPNELGRAHQKVYDDVSDETGIGFDLAYIKRTREEHRRLLKRYEDMAENAKDMEVKQFASKQLPLLRQHLQQAETLEDRLGRI